MKKIITIPSAALLLVAVLFFGSRYLAPAENETRELVISVLQTLPRSFLVLLTHETLAVTHRDRSTWLLGVRRGQSTLAIRIHWGVDLSKVKPGDIRVSGHHVTIRLPDPQILDVVPDLATWKFIGKRSGLHAAKDTIRGRSLESELLRDVQRAIPKYRSQDFHVQRLAIIDRLNRNTADLFADSGLSVKFE